jgi:geranylgeranyl diphosphate synthase, type II
LNKIKSGKFDSLFEGERVKIEKKLKKSLENRKPESLYHPASYILQSGGKRLRPLLVLFSSAAVGGKFSQVYNAALAVELLHNFTLVHDDIMDNADKRRGLLTLHKKYDTNTAILTGDSLLSVAYEFLLKDSGSHSHSVIASFTKGLVEVCEGQSIDKEFEVRSSVTIIEYIKMIEKKTAAMLEMCCSIGAQIGGGNTKEIRALSKFGKNLGIAFQIQDDMLDIMGDEKEFGKSVGGDLVEGKKTFLFLTAAAKAGEKDLPLLNKLITDKGINKKNIPEYKLLYEKLGVIDDAQNEIKFYTGKAIKSLNNLESEEYSDFFKWLAGTLIKRIK